jgi:RNA polymerase sigma-70 factor (ECF subfamily)
MQPDVARPNPELEKFRAYLAFLVRRRLDDRLQGKLDPSGVVQQTLFEAHQGLKDLRGRSDAEVAAWLRQILGLKRLLEQFSPSARSSDAPRAD